MVMMEERHIVEEEYHFHLRDITLLHIEVGLVVAFIMGILTLILQWGWTGVYFGGAGAFLAGWKLTSYIRLLIEQVKDIQAERSQAKQIAAPKGDKDTRLLTNWRDDGDNVLVPEEQAEHVTSSSETRFLPVFPTYPENETLRLGKEVATGRRFDPHFDMALGRGFVSAGVQGSGKSMLNGRIVEQAGKCDIPTVVLDHKGEYDPITELPFLNGFRVGATNEFDFMLTVDNAYQLVSLVMKNHYQAVVNLPSYGDAWVDRAQIVAAVSKALMSYARNQFRQNKKPLPCLVLVDEAQLYIPQHRDLLPSEAQENRKALSDLNSTLYALATNGRSNGYTMLFSAPSLTFIAKAFIKSCEIKVLMKHTEKNDLDMCEEIVNKSVAARQDMHTFPAGTGVVFGLTEDEMVVKFDKKQSDDRSETPKLARLREPRQDTDDYPVYRTPEPTPVRSPLPEQRAHHTYQHPKTLPPLGDLVWRNGNETVPQPEPPAQEIRYAPRVQPPVAPVRQSVPKLRPELQMVLNVYSPGMPYRDLGKMLGIGKDKAGELLKELRDLGLL
jgi:hypothetical protein